MTGNKKITGVSLYMYMYNGRISYRLYLIKQTNGNTGFNIRIHDEFLWTIHIFYYRSTKSKTAKLVLYSLFKWIEYKMEKPENLLRFFIYSDHMRTVFINSIHIIWRKKNPEFWEKYLNAIFDAFYNCF